MDKFTSVLQEIAAGNAITTNIYIARNGFLYIDGKRVDYTGYINLNGECIKFIMGQAVVPSPYVASIGSAISVEDGSDVEYKTITDDTSFGVLERCTYSPDDILMSRDKYDHNGNCIRTELDFTDGVPATEICYIGGRPIRVVDNAKEETYFIEYGMSTDLQRTMTVVKYVKGKLDVKYVWCFDTDVLSIDGVSYTPKWPIPEFRNRIIPRVQYDGLVGAIVKFRDKQWNKL